jgi:hypothetical protein
VRSGLRTRTSSRASAGRSPRTRPTKSLDDLLRGHANLRVTSALTPQRRIDAARRDAELRVLLALVVALLSSQPSPTSRAGVSWRRSASSSTPPAGLPAAGWASGCRFAAATSWRCSAAPQHDGRAAPEPAGGARDRAEAPPRRDHALWRGARGVARHRPAAAPDRRDGRRRDADDRGLPRRRQGRDRRAGRPSAGRQRFELPLVGGQTTYGRLVLSGDSFSIQDVETASILVGHAVVALENARLHQVVERQARLDGLTGLPNRRRAEDALATELARAARFSSPLAVVLADIDDFKLVNDRHGHATGDTVLRELANVLRTSVREIDLCARWGGGVPAPPARR